jgi:hypothetical protein
MHIQLSDDGATHDVRFVLEVKEPPLALQAAITVSRQEQTVPLKVNAKGLARRKESRAARTKRRRMAICGVHYLKLLLIDVY